MTSPLLEVRNLCKSYDEGRIEALRGVDLSIRAGEYVAISGPSGSGKSTLLHLLGGLDTPTSGQVLFLNQPLGSAVDLDDYRAHQVGFIFQAFYLLPTLDALENVQVPMLGVSRDASNRAERAECLLREVGLENRLHQYPNELSAGERQRALFTAADGAVDRAYWESGQRQLRAHHGDARRHSAKARHDPHRNHA